MIKLRDVNATAAHKLEAVSRSFPSTSRRVADGLFTRLKGALYPDRAVCILHNLRVVLDDDTIDETAPRLTDFRSNNAKEGNAASFTD